MAKKVKTVIKLQVIGGQATPAPPVGPALSQHGINAMEFCKSFNAKTKDKQGVKIPVVIDVYKDGSFSFITKTPPASFLIKKAIGIEKGSGEPNRVKVGKITRDQLEEIAKTKMKDLTAADLDAAVNSIKGTAINMGILIEE